MCCNCSIPSWAKWGNLWVHPCLGCCHLPVTQSFQWVKLLDRTFHVGLSCAQFCSSNDSIISNDQILDDSQRPLPSVFVSVLMITTSPKAGVSLPAPHCAQCLSRRLRWSIGSILLPCTSASVLLTFAGQRSQCGAAAILGANCSSKTT